MTEPIRKESIVVLRALEEYYASASLLAVSVPRFIREKTRPARASSILTARADATTCDAQRHLCARSARIVRVGATAAGEAARPCAWSGVAAPRHRESQTLPRRATRDRRARARLLASAGTRAHATPATNGSNCASGRAATP